MSTFYFLEVCSIWKNSSRPCKIYFHLFTFYVSNFSFICISFLHESVWKCFKTWWDWSYKLFLILWSSNLNCLSPYRGFFSSFSCFLIVLLKNISLFRLFLIIFQGIAFVLFSFISVHHPCFYFSQGKMICKIFHTF